MQSHAARRQPGFDRLPHGLRAIGMGFQPDFYQASLESASYGSVAEAGESRGGSPRHMKVLLMAAAFPP
jgi:hypothetical protein